MLRLRYDVCLQVSNFQTTFSVMGTSHCKLVHQSNAISMRAIYRVHLELLDLLEKEDQKGQLVTMEKLVQLVHKVLRALPEEKGLPEKRESLEGQESL